VDTLSPEAIVKVAQSLFGEDSALVKAAAEEGTHEAEGEAEGTHEAEGEAEAEGTHEAEGESAEEKTAQADFLGRVMAHAFVQEQAQITKEADLKSMAGTVGGRLKSLGSKGWEGLKKVPSAAKGAPKSLSDKAKAMKGSYRKGTAAAGGSEGFAAQQHAGGRLAGLKRLHAEHPKTVKGLVGLGLAGAAGTEEAVRRHEKNASAVDVLAEQRAMEILEQNGIGQDGDTKLASAVEERAWEMLAANGYVKDEE